MEAYFVFFGFLVLLHVHETGAGHSHDSSSDDSDDVAHCDPFCDALGYYRSEQWCFNDEYCCGSENFRYCCNDPEKDVEGLYEPVTQCPNSSWWVYHWRVILGVLGTLMMVLIVTSCCYYCCVQVFSNRRRNHPHHPNENESELPSVVSNTEVTGATGGIVFNPDHPYAFVPPEYDTLPKEPPKYAEVFDNVTSSASTNQAFCGDGDLPAAPPSFDDLPAPPGFQPAGPNSLMNEQESPPPRYEDGPFHVGNISTTARSASNPFVGLPPEDTFAAGNSNTVNPSTT